MLFDVFSHLPNETTLCLFHTFTLNQVPPPARQELNDFLLAYSQHRTIYRLSCDG